MIYDKFVTFIPQLPLTNKYQISTKAIIYPDNGNIFSFTENNLVVISFKMIDKEKVHKDHGLIELYNGYFRDKDFKLLYGLLELEQHSEYKLLKQGETFTTEQTWQILEYKGLNSMKEHINFIKKTKIPDGEK